MERKHLLGLVLVLIAVGVGSAFWLMSDEERGSEPLNVLSSATDRGGAQPALPVVPGTRSDEAHAPQPVALGEALAEPGARSMPESYRRALGGLTGRVLEADLTPVADMTVELGGGRASTVLFAQRDLLSGNDLDIHAIVASAKTDVDGRFHMADIDPRTVGVLLVDPGGPRSLIKVLDVTPVGGEEKDLGDIVLPLSATLTGFVVDETNLPVPGARVRATEFPYIVMVPEVADFRAGGGVVVSKDETDLNRDLVFRPPAGLALLEKRLPVPTTFTDADGHFVLPGVTPGLVTLVVDEEHHRSLVRDGVPTGAAGGRQDLGKILIGNGVTLRVAVVDSEGKSVPESLAMAGSSMAVAPAAVLREPVDREESGEFVFDGLKPGSGYVVARRPDRDEYKVLAVPDVSVGRVKITLPSTTKLTVTVTDPDGQPLSGVRFLGRLSEEQDVPDFLLRPRPLADRTEESEPGTYLISELQPGAWDMVAALDGYALERFRENLTAGPTEHELELVPGQALTVQVVRASDGEPVEYARVNAMPKADGFPRPIAIERTDADGFARLTDLPNGTITLLVTHPALAVTQLEAKLPSKETLLVELVAGGRIVGRVTDNGLSPPAPMTVVLEPRGAEGDAQLPRLTITDLDGRFAFERVDPGDVRIEVRARSGIGSAPSLIDTFFDSPLAKDTATVPPMGEVSVLLDMGQAFADMDTGWVTGDLVVNGRPADGWKVRTFDKIRRSATTDSAGRFDLGRLAAGDVTVMISSPGMGLEFAATETRAFALGKDERHHESIRFSTGSVSGRVVSDHDGRPVPGAIVTTEDAREDRTWGRQMAAPTLPDGSFHIDPVVSGKYRVSARADGYATANSETFELGELQQKGGLVLRMRPAVVVSGTLSIEGLDEMPEWMWLVARSKDGSQRDTSSVNKETLAFSFDRLAPGEWTFSLATNPDRDYEPQTVDIQGDRDDLVLTFTADTSDEAQFESPFVYEDF